MPQIILLTDENIIEGMIGTFGAGIASIVIHHILKTPKIIILAISFIISWFIRKIGLNLYKFFKKNGIFSINPLKFKR